MFLWNLQVMGYWTKESLEFGSSNVKRKKFWCIRWNIAKTNYIFQDSNILGYWYSSDIKVAYILILGVRKQYRRYGIGEWWINKFWKISQSQLNQRNMEVIFGSLLNLHLAFKMKLWMDFDDVFLICIFRSRLPQLWYVSTRWCWLNISNMSY